MLDEVTTTEVTTAAPVVAEPVVAPEAKTFTQDQVNAIVQERLAKDRVSRPAAAAPKPTPAPTAAPTASASVEDLNAKLTELTQRLEFKDRVSGRGLDADQSEALFQVFKANPTGFDKAVSVFGIKDPTPATSVVNTATQVPPAPVHAPAAVAPSAPSGHGLPTQNGVIDLFSLTSDQLKNLGPSGVRQQLEKLSQIQQQAAGIPQRAKPPSQR